VADRNGTVAVIDIQKAALFKGFIKAIIHNGQMAVMPTADGRYEQDCGRYSYQ
jgi:hypothetical protein